MSIGSDIVLTQAVIGQPLLLVKIDGGKDVNRRLIELGLTPGVKLRLIQDSGGPVILAVRDSRIALGRGMANKIIVSPEETLS
jgi:Fe2+ transport system protein FeoA